MTVEIVAKVAASASLEDLNTLIAQNEQTIGALTNIGNEKAFTTLAFAIGSAPAQHAIISRNEAGRPAISEGASVIDTDLVFLAGVLTLCTASRPPAPAQKTPPG